MLARTLILKTSALGPVERMVRKSFLFKRIVRRFIAGDSLEEAMVSCEGLIEKGFLITLDYLGENAQTESEANAASESYVEMLRRLASEKCPAASNISIKLTQCGLDQGDAFAERNLRRVLQAAKECDAFVRVDMEGSAYTERTIEMIKRVWPDFQNTGTVLQSYLFRTRDDVETMIRMGVRTRLVKGAYLEPESIAYRQKSKVDEAYLESAKRMLDAANYPALATHDEKIIRAIRSYVVEKNIERSRFEFQMLYGIRRDLQESLRSDGFNVRVYVPFGESWYPYFTRRLAERPANVMFILKSLFKR